MVAGGADAACSKLQVRTKTLGTRRCVYGKTPRLCPRKRRRENMPKPGSQYGVFVYRQGNWTTCRFCTSARSSGGVDRRLQIAMRCGWIYVRKVVKVGRRADDRRSQGSEQNRVLKPVLELTAQPTYTRGIEGVQGACAKVASQRSVNP